MKPGDVVYLNLTHPSFSWANGLYVVLDINEKDNDLTICKIDEKGNARRYDDGKYTKGHTGISNVIPTKMTYELEKAFLTHRLPNPAAG